MLSDTSFQSSCRRLILRRLRVVRRMSSCCANLWSASWSCRGTQPGTTVWTRSLTTASELYSIKTKRAGEWVDVLKPNRVATHQMWMYTSWDVSLESYFTWRQVATVNPATWCKNVRLYLMGQALCTLDATRKAKQIRMRNFFFVQQFCSHCMC